MPDEQDGHREDDPCPEKTFALREAIRRTNALQSVLDEAHAASDMELKLAVSNMAQREASEIAAVLARVVVVLQRCIDTERS